MPPTKPSYVTSREQLQEFQAKYTAQYTHADHSDLPARQTSTVTADILALGSAEYPKAKRELIAAGRHYIYDAAGNIARMGIAFSAGAHLLPEEINTLDAAHKADKDKITANQYYRLDNPAELQSVALTGAYLQSAFRSLFNMPTTTVSDPGDPDFAQQNTAYFDNLYKRALTTDRLDLRTASPQAFARFFTGQNLEVIPTYVDINSLDALWTTQPTIGSAGADDTFAARLDTLGEVLGTDLARRNYLLTNLDRPDVREQIITKAQYPLTFAAELKETSEILLFLNSKDPANLTGPTLSQRIIDLSDGLLEDTSSLNEILTFLIKNLNRPEIRFLLNTVPATHDAAKNRLINAGAAAIPITSEFFADAGAFNDIKEKLRTALVATKLVTKEKAPELSDEDLKDLLIEHINHPEIQAIISEPDVQNAEEIVEQIKKLAIISGFARDIDVKSAAAFVAATEKGKLEDKIGGPPAEYIEPYRTLKTAAGATYEVALTQTEAAIKKNGNARIANSAQNPFLVKFGEELSAWFRNNYPGQRRLPANDKEKAAFAIEFLKQMAPTTGASLSERDATWLSNRFRSILPKFITPPSPDFEVFLRNLNVNPVLKAAFAVKLGGKPTDEITQENLFNKLLQLYSKSASHDAFMATLAEVTDLNALDGYDAITNAINSLHAAVNATAPLVAPTKIAAYLEQAPDKTPEAAENFMAPGTDFEKNEKEVEQVRQRQLKSKTALANERLNSIQAGRKWRIVEIEKNQWELRRINTELETADRTKKAGLLEKRNELLEKQTRYGEDMDFFLNTEMALTLKLNGQPTHFRGIQSLAKRTFGGILNSLTGSTFNTQSLPAHTLPSGVKALVSRYERDKNGIVREYTCFETKDGVTFTLLSNADTIGVYESIDERQQVARNFLSAVLSSPGALSIPLNRSDALAVYYNFALTNPQAKFQLGTVMSGIALGADVLVYSIGFIIGVILTFGFSAVWAMQNPEKTGFRKAWDIFKYSTHDYGMLHLKEEAAKSWKCKMLEQYEQLKFGRIADMDKYDHDGEQSFKSKMGPEGTAMWNAEEAMLNEPKEVMLEELRNQYRKDHPLATEIPADVDKSYQLQVCEAILSLSEDEKLGIARRIEASGGEKKETEAMPGAKTEYRMGALR